MSKEDIYDEINKRLQPSQKLQGSEIQPARNECRVRGQNLKCLINSLAARPVFFPLTWLMAKARLTLQGNKASADQCSADLS